MTGTLSGDCGYPPLRPGGDTESAATALSKLSPDSPYQPVPVARGLTRASRQPRKNNAAATIQNPNAIAPATSKPTVARISVGSGTRRSQPSPKTLPLDGGRFDAYQSASLARTSALSFSDRMGLTRRVGPRF